MSGLQRPITLSAIQEEFSQGGIIVGRNNSLGDYRGIPAFDHQANAEVILPDAPLSFSDFENLSWYSSWVYAGSNVTIINQPRSRSVFSNTGSVSFVVEVDIAQPPKPTDITRPNLLGPRPRLDATTFEWQLQEPGSSSWQTVQTVETVDTSNTLSLSLDFDNGNVLNLSGNKYRCVITSPVIAANEVTGIEEQVAETQVITNEATLTVSVAEFDAPINNFGTPFATVKNPEVFSGTTTIFSSGSIRVRFSGGAAGTTFARAAPGRTISSQSNSVVWQISFDSGSSWQTVPSSWLVSGGYDGLQISNIVNDDLDNARLRAVFNSSMTQTPPSETKSDSDITTPITLNVNLIPAGLATLNNVCSTSTTVVEGIGPVIYTLKTSNLGKVQYTSRGQINFTVTNNSGRFNVPFTDIFYTTSTDSPTQLSASQLSGSIAPNYQTNITDISCPGGDNGSRLVIGPFPKLNKHMPEAVETIVFQTPGLPGWNNVQTESAAFVVQNAPPELFVEPLQFLGGPSEPKQAFLEPGDSFTLEVFGTNFPEVSANTGRVKWAITGLPSGYLTSPLSGNISCSFNGPPTSGLYSGFVTFEADDFSGPETGIVTFELKNSLDVTVATRQFTLTFDVDKSTYSVTGNTDWIFSPSSGTPSPGFFIPVGNIVELQFDRSGSTEDVESVSVLSFDDSQAPPTTIKKIRSDGRVRKVNLSFTMPPYPTVVNFTTAEPNYAPLSASYSPCAGVSSTTELDCSTGLGVSGNIALTAPSFTVEGGSGQSNIVSQTATVTNTTGMDTSTTSGSNTSVTVSYSVFDSGIGTGDSYTVSASVEFSTTIQDTITGETQTISTTCSGTDVYVCSVNAPAPVTINSGGRGSYTASPQGNFTVFAGDAVVIEIYAAAGTPDPVITTSCVPGTLAGSNGFWTYTFTAPANGCALIADNEALPPSPIGPPTAPIGPPVIEA